MPDSNNPELQNLRAELSEMIDQAEWEWLLPHAQRDAVVIVDTTLDLLDVGVAIASDNVAAVQHWISEQQLAKPSPEQLTNWNADRTYRFNALIVQPYVLVQAV